MNDCDTNTNTDKTVKISQHTANIEMKSSTINMQTKLKTSNKKDEYTKRQICMLAIASVLGVCIVGASISLMVFDILALGNHFQNVRINFGVWYFVLASMCWCILSFVRGILDDIITIKSVMIDVGLMVWGSIELWKADVVIRQTAIYRMALIHVLLNYTIYAGVVCLFCIGLYVA